jgi:hypothetical protein
MVFTTENLVVIAAIVLLGPASVCLGAGLQWLLRRHMPSTWVRVPAAMVVSTLVAFKAYIIVLDHFSP